MDTQEMVNAYPAWIQNQIAFKQMDDYIEITLPYLDRFDDCLQVYVKQKNNNDLLLTDDGYIIGNLIACGLMLNNSSTKYTFLKKILYRYNLTLEKEAIIATATVENFPQKMSNMIQALLLIDNML